MGEYIPDAKHGHVILMRGDLPTPTVAGFAKAGALNDKQCKAYVVMRYL